MIGKKKAKDIQFFREAADASFDETGNKKRRRNFADEDELEQEQEERKRRTELNKYFKAFGDKISEAVSIMAALPLFFCIDTDRRKRISQTNARVEVDMPFRGQSFSSDVQRDRLTHIPAATQSLHSVECRSDQMSCSNRPRIPLSSSLNHHSSFSLLVKSKLLIWNEFNTG